MPTIRSSRFWCKFGKKRAKRDKRNFAFASLIMRKPVLPAEYDFDEKYIAVPTPMFGNDYHGDCVIAGRGHQTLRFEYIERHSVLKISESDVLREWHKENGNTESGLVVLDSLKLWRKRGWKAVGKSYKIHAFAEVDRGNHLEVRQAIFMQVGIGLGVTLPYGALPQFNAGKIWDVVPGHAGKPDPEGGHYVYCPGYTKRGPVCVTWGRKQQMTWAFFDKYSDEAYTIVDEKDASMKKKAGLKGAIDMPRVAQLLEGK